MTSSCRSPEYMMPCPHDRSSKHLPKWATIYLHDKRNGQRITSRYKFISNLARYICYACLCFGLIFVTTGTNLVPWIPNYQQRFKSCTRNDFKCFVDGTLTQFDQLLSQQSKSVTEAKHNYRTRYKRSPPPGFDDWYKYAYERNATLIDEYDQIEVDLAPFRALRLTQEQITRRMENAWEEHQYSTGRQHSLSFITITEGRLITGNSTKLGSYETLLAILEPIVSHLPDLTILYNWYSEPRTILSSDRNEKSISDNVYYEDYSQTSPWEALRAPCSLQSSVRKRASRSLLSRSVDKDICAMPSYARQQHGFFVAPNNFHPTHTLLPIISNGKVSTMGDIVGPPPCYFEDKYRHIDAVDTIPFDKKMKDVYWRGTTTGMIMHKRHWLEGHRQRFVYRASKVQESIREIKSTMDFISVGPESATTNAWPALFSLNSSSKEGKSRLHHLSRLSSTTFDVGFSNFVHCETGICREVQKFLPLLEQTDPSEDFKHQIVADLDGESMSCRFYRMLHSGSLPLKQSIYQEWHDDRLFPWVHYIPLSLEMDELIPLVSWLLTTDEGQQYGQQIARRGQTWAQRSLRQQDATIYLYRLFLEYARLLKEF